MTTYNSLISRADISTLEQPEYSNQIFAAMTENSIVARMAKRLPNMGASTKNLPVLSALPQAYFVSEGGLKQSTEANWENKMLNVEEIACIVPIPEAVLADASVPIFDNIKPYIAEAIGKTFDGAVLFDTNSPASWPNAIITDATAKSKVISLAAHTDLYDAMLGDNGVLQAIEDSGFTPDGIIASIKLKGKMRSQRSSDGTPLFASQNGFDGIMPVFPKTGIIDPDTALAIAGEWGQLVYAVRQDITYKLLDQAVLSDADGKIVLNFAQQDCVGLRVTFRVAWQLPNPVNSTDTTANRYPFAVLTA